MKYLFVFGNAPELAGFEVERVLERNGIGFKFLVFSDAAFLVETDSPIQIEVLAVLGGTVKVGEVFFEGDFSSTTEMVIDYLVGLSREKITFGVSLYGLAQGLVIDAREIKRELLAKGIRGRFILPARGAQELSSVVVKKQGVVEVLTIVTGDVAVLARTVFVQDFEDWGKRDYGRPGVAAHLGMLPPKVARMMVNVGLPGTILDPFCGVGTILAEALSLGASVIGSDIDARQVERTRRNLDWLRQNFQVPASEFQLFVGDARNVSQKIGSSSVDAVVTEPDLGLNNPAINQIDGKMRERLANLYVSSMAEWKKVLKEGGRVVIALPSFAASNAVSVSSDVLEGVIDKAKLMGYSLEAGPFPYFRSQARVRRNVCIFRYGTH